MLMQARACICAGVLAELLQARTTRTQDAQVAHVRQRPHVGRQQRQARPRVDDQLTVQAVMAPDGLAMLQGGQGDRHVFPEHVVCTPCKARHNVSALHTASTSRHDHFPVSACAQNSAIS